MKYYLIKCNCERPNTEPFWSDVKKVELTEKELQNLLKADARYESKDVWVSVQYIQEKIRKVL